jgi:hypothetical protein
VISAIAAPIKNKTLFSSRIFLRSAVYFTLLTLFGFAASAHAQVDTGAILGNVTDAAGSVIPGASVTITEEGTGLTQTQNTGADGGFSFTPVKIGNYTLTVAKPGFKTSVQKHVEVTVQSHLEINPKLR